MLKTIRSLRLPLSRRYLHGSPACLRLSASDKLWIAASGIDPTSRDYTRDLRLVRPPKNPSAKALPQIARKIVESNPDIGIPQAVRKIAERAGYGWGKCEECSKGGKNAGIASLTPRVSNSHEQEDIPSLLLLPLPPFASPGSAKLPHHIISATCQDLSDLTFQFGSLPDHKSPEVRSQYVATLWKRIIPLFQGLLTSTVERRLERSGEDGEVEAPEVIKQKFEVFGSYPAVFLHTDISAPSTQLPQVINETEICDYENAMNGLWSPVIAIVSNGSTFQFLIYNSITSPMRVSASQLYPGLSQASGKAFVDSVRDVMERLYYIFLCAFVNGIKAQVRRASAMYGEEEGGGPWGAAADEGEKAVVMARGGWDLGSEENALEAIQALERSINYINQAAEDGERKDFGYVKDLQRFFST